tara:strand:+ start:1516 stop:2046 length:531 start_codon:yes stop_codon:yes gene_type:complete
MTVSIANLTTNIVTSATNVVTGDGVLDDMMETVNAHLAAQFNLGRITGTDYATVYLTAIQAALQQAVAYTLGIQKGNAEESLLNQKEITEFAQTDQTSKTAPSVTSVMGAQAALSVEQAKGFKWNADQKYLKTILDAWAINTSTAGVAATTVTAINSGGVGTDLNQHIVDAEPLPN